jgi:hypothetical protein
MQSEIGRSVLFLALSASSLFGVSGSLAAQESRAKALVMKVVEEAGGVDALHERKDVEYTYLYRRAGTATVDLSLERYVFDGEKSWALYRLHEGLHTSGPGPVVQGYDGSSTWQTVAGVRSKDPKSLARADFLRKTNFYWFAMTFKLLDPGVRYTYEGKKKVDATMYETVKIGFDEGVGDVSDTYVLYINPENWRVDQFLFTVLDFGKTDPFLMKVEYERIDGVLLPVKRRYAPSSWSGEVSDSAQWTDEVSIGVRFNNGFDDSLFEAPAP